MKELRLLVFTEAAFSFLIFTNNSCLQWSITGNKPKAFGKPVVSSADAEKIIFTEISKIFSLKLKGERS